MRAFSQVAGMIKRVNSVSLVISSKERETQKSSFVFLKLHRTEVLTQ